MFVLYQIHVFCEFIEACRGKVTIHDLHNVNWRSTIDTAIELNRDPQNPVFAYTLSGVPLLKFVLDDQVCFAEVQLCQCLSVEKL